MRHRVAGQLVQLTVSRRTDRVSIPAIKESWYRGLLLGYSYAQLGASPLAAVTTIASTDCAYPLGDGQAELAWVAGYIARWDRIFARRSLV